jgi:hypothetical protein
VERENRFRRVAVHSLGFRDANTPFLRALALENGGTYSLAGRREPAR